MPRYWHDKHATAGIDDEKDRIFCRSIVAEKKPYFMRYIYPALQKQYNTFISSTERNCQKEFRMTVGELKSLPYDELSDRQKDFLRFYDLKMPVGIGNCVMNKICRLFENEFDGYVSKRKSTVQFDCSILKSNVEYSQYRYKAIKNVYTQYQNRLQNYVVFSKYERIDEFGMHCALERLDEEFRTECALLCSDSSALCDIILDICYKKNSTKRFVWAMCGSEIIHNLLKKNNNIINVVAACEDGDVCYCGERYTVIQKEVCDEIDNERE